MRTPAALVVVLLLCIAAVGADLFPLTPPGVEQLQIHNDRIVGVYLGNPGKWLRMRVRSDTARIYLFQHSSVYSQTWKALPITDDYGQPMIRDTLVLGKTQFRADIVVGRFPDESPATVEGTQAEGVLGIGATSPLWTVWRNYTKSRDALMLGQVLHLQSDVKEVSLVSTLPPPWTYSADLVPTLVTEYIAVLSEDSRHELEHACRRALGSVVDDSADFAHSDQLLASVLGVRADDQLCTIPSEYRLLLAPNSDYNVVPRALLMHAPNHPPVFHLRSTLAAEPTLLAVLFNRHDDTYVELDTTNRAGDGVRRMANRARSGKNNTIVLGEYGLRRFDLGYDLDRALGYLSIKHNGLAHSSQSKAAEHSIEVRRFNDIFIVVPGLLLWALWATRPDPVYPRHESSVAETKRFPHSRRDAITRDTPIVPPPVRQLYIQAEPDSAAFTVAINQVQTPQLLETVPSHRMWQLNDEEQGAKKAKPAATDERQRQLTQLAHETSVRVGAVLRASFRMRSEWPLSETTLHYVQALGEGLIAVYFMMALGFYDSTWSLSLVLNSNATSTTLGWTTIAILVGCLYALSLVAVVAAGRDASVGSLALQCEILIGIYVLMVAMFQWDLALALLFVISTLITIVLIVGTLTTCGVVPQYQQYVGHDLGSLRSALVTVTIGWVVYAAFGLFPFIVDRLWDNEDHALIISIFLVASVALPISIYMSFGPFVYPLLVAVASCQRIFTAAQQRYCAITGSPGV